MIPYGRQSINDDDIQTVVEVLNSDFLTQGPIVPEFERQTCKVVGAKYGVAVNSGTSALHIACLALELGEGDWLWTTPISFVASANCGLYCGANIDFVDIDPRTCNISVTKLKDKLKLAQQQNRLPKVLVAVHFGGLCCDMEEIHYLSQEYGFHVIEDACHAIGGKYKGKAIGSCLYSDITVFSFHPVKTITSGEGGMSLTNDAELAKKMNLFRSHGITRDEEEMTEELHGPWYYQQIALGYNYRLTDIQAALGLSQLKRLSDFVSRRHEIAKYYNEQLKALPLRLPCCKDEKSYSGMHLYVIRLELEEINQTHRQVFESMRQQGIGVNLHYIPIHTQPVYQKMGFREGDFPEAEKYYREALSLPIFPDLSYSQAEKVIMALKSIF